jgi:hypothetical protein
MPFLLIAVGLIYWLNFTIRAWSVVGTDNYALVNSYSNTALMGLWFMVIGGVWLLRKR